ncbi:hypothetical protein DIPPA_10314 [Diplonema papillatum]|nr:hypothetical protein DIPPA_10314 [Diplonema papillatum]
MSQEGCSASAEGSGVEWWTMVKLPKVRSADSNIDRGVAYAYIDAAGAGAKFTLAPNSLQDPARADPLAQTLVPLYGADPNAAAWLLFSDEHPDNKTTKPPGFGWTTPSRCPTLIQHV